MTNYSRHIHLDFHTSEHLTVGDRFDPEGFIDTLKDASVNSIVVFAKCHHSWCYYPTEVGHMHPGLSFDLLGEQIKACKKAGIRVIAYITGAWSESDAIRHPEWQAVDPSTGKPVYTWHGKQIDAVPGKPDEPRTDCFWSYLCLNGEYGDHVKAITREVLDKYDVDGLFFDIMGLNIPCGCPTCVERASALGYDVKDADSMKKYAVLARRKLLRELRDMVDEKGRGLTVFFNSGGADIDKPEYLEFSTHYEMENMPSKSSTGYDAIINRSKFFRETGKEVYGMTGKFHITWGEFGGFKHPMALVQECLADIAYGVHCNIGDQMHPSGVLNPDTYRLIGKAYEHVKGLEDYIDCGRTVSRLGLMLPETQDDREGYAKLLADCHYDYRVIVSTDILPELDFVMLASPITLTENQESDLCDFVARGGKLILFGKPLGADRLLSAIGYRSLGDSEYDNDYVCFPGDGEDSLDAPILMYDRAHRFQMEGEKLASVYEPYFSRTVARFCSHRNTPNRIEAADYPAILLGKNALCFAHRYGEQYFRYGNYWCRTLFHRAMKRFYTPELELEELPVFGRYTFYKRGNEYILNLLGLLPIQRRNCAVLEDPIELRDIKVTLKGIAASSVTLMPDNKAIDFTLRDGDTAFTLPSLKGHALLVIK